MRPRIRSIKPEIWRDLAGVSRDARHLLVVLISLADDEGRFLAAPATILGHGYPMDTDAPRKLEAWLQELANHGHLVRYEVAGIPYGWITGWGQHQKVNRPTPSKLPEPPTAEPEQAYKKRAIPEATRRAVARAAGGIPGESTDAACAKCGAAGQIHWARLSSGRAGSWVQFDRLEMDHIVPEYLGGTAEPDNIQLLCQRCNRSKGARAETDHRAHDARDEYGERAA